MSSALRMVHDVDPAKVLMEALGDLSAIDVYNDRILVAIYKRPEKTKGGVIIPGTAGPREEEKYQGKACLVVKLGPLVNIDQHKARGAPIEVGDWLMTFPTDGRNLDVNGVACRLLKEDIVHMKIASPDLVY